jgi:acyl CoA:acetate/3-ketoacid CoA transferase beta subunit
MTTDYSIDELIAVCVARQVQDGEILAQGIATPLVMAGYILARCTHAPNVGFASAIGQGLCYEWSPLSIANVEAQWLEQSVINVGFVQAVADLLPRLQLKEFFRPGQVNAQGDFNNIAFGKDYTRPRLRLPGTGGIPDVTPSSEHVFLYVPRHSRVTFVENLDYRSGLGKGVQYLVTDLGEFDFVGGRMRLTHLHPGVKLSRMQAKTGFDFAIAPHVSETPPPTRTELHLLRNDIDPYGVRKLELLGGNARKRLLREILALEGVLSLD